MKKKLLLLLFILTLTTSCHSYTELSDLGITSMLGLDYQDNQFIIYANIISNQQEQTPKKQYKTYQATGKTIEEAFKNIYIQNSKKVYLSHMDLLVITNNLIDNQLKALIDNFLTNNEYRNNFQMITVKEDIEKLFTSEISAEEINKLITINEKESATTKSIDFETFLKSILIDHNAILPTIKVEDTVKIEGITLIKDQKIYDTLSTEEAILFNFLTNKVEKTTFQDITVYENETIITTKKNQVNIEITSTIDQQEEKYQTELKKALLKLLTHYQQEQYDLLKLEYKIYQNDYRYYQKNNNILSKLKFNIDIHTTIKENYLEKEITYE